MSKKEEFTSLIQKAYTFENDHIILGAAMLDGEIIADAKVSVPLATMNRHGLIAGATGTGKTKTLQVLAENLSLASVPVVMMDIKGDLSGLLLRALRMQGLLIAMPKLTCRGKPTVSPWNCSPSPTKKVCASVPPYPNSAPY
jgi:hypothetical protein